MSKIIFGLGIIGMCILQIFNNTDVNVLVENNKSIEEKVDIAEEKINEAINSETYNEMSLSEREEFAQNILFELEQDGYIKNLVYDNINYVYSFEYIDGMLGGWKIEDFSGKDDFLPMN